MRLKTSTEGETNDEDSIERRMAVTKERTREQLNEQESDTMTRKDGESQ